MKYILTMLFTASLIFNLLLVQDDLAAREKLHECSTYVASEFNSLSSKLNQSLNRMCKTYYNPEKPEIYEALHPLCSTRF